MFDPNALCSQLEQEIQASSEALNAKKDEVAVRAARLREAETEATLLEGSIMQLRRTLNRIRHSMAQSQQASEQSKSAGSES
ncbi:MAG: hypothetical protein H0T60_06485 [Acidobacteria bacterium]|nr:hypothetical protein [Acidobacteriota bacterium]